MKFKEYFLVYKTKKAIWIQINHILFKVRFISNIIYIQESPKISNVVSFLEFNDEIIECSGNLEEPAPKRQRQSHSDPNSALVDEINAIAKNIENMEMNI